MGDFITVGRDPKNADVLAMDVTSGCLYPSSRFSIFLPVLENEKVVREPLSIIFSILFGLFKKDCGISKPDKYMNNVNWRRDDSFKNQMTYEFTRKDNPADLLVEVSPDLNASEGKGFITSYLKYVLNYKDNHFENINFDYINKIVGEDIREWSKVADDYIVWAKEIAGRMLEKLEEGNYAYKEHVWHGDVWD